MAVDYTSQSLLLVMMLAGVGPHSCPSNCKICSVKLTNCDAVSSLQEVLPGLSNSTEAIILLNGGLNAIPPEAFQNFSRLRWLYINGCLVSSLEKRTFVTGEGNSLQELDLNNNRLQSCTVDILAFAGLARLEKLILTNNALDALKASWFMDMKFLTKLNMSANMINYIPPRTFETLSTLDHLDLADNRIQYLHTDTFFGLDSLTELNVSRNLILFIDEHTFEPLKALQVLRLAGNSLVTLKALPELVGFVYLHQNPWECSCTFFNLVVSLKEKIVDVSSVLCDMPTYLKGEQVVHVGPDICINATMPPGYLPQEGLTRYAPLYSFLAVMLDNCEKKPERPPWVKKLQLNHPFTCLIQNCMQHLAKWLSSILVSKRDLEWLQPGLQVRRDTDAVLDTTAEELGFTKDQDNVAGGFLCALIICLIIYFISKHSKQSRTPKPVDQRSNKIHSSLTGAVQENPMKVKGTPELSKCCLSSEVKQPLPNVLQTKFLEKTQCHLSWHPSDGVRKHIHAVSLVDSPKMVPAVRTPNKRSMETRKDNAEAIQETVGSDLGGNQFLDTVLNGMSESSTRTEGLTKSLTAPDLLFASQEQQRLNPLKIVHSIEDCTGRLHLKSEDPQSCITQNVKSSTYDPQSYNVQGLKPTLGEPKSFNQQGLQPTLLEPILYSVQGSESTQEDLKFLSAQHLQPTCDDTNCYSRHVVQPMHDDPKPHNTQGVHLTNEDTESYNQPDLQPILNGPKVYSTQDQHTHDDSNIFSQLSPHDPKCYVGQGRQPIGEEETFNTTHDLRSSHNNPKYYSEPNLHPNPKDSKCYIQPDFFSPYAQPKCYNANGLYQTQNNEKYCTQDALSITVDAKSLKTLNSCPITEGLQVAVMLPSAGRLDCLHLPNLLPKTDQLHTKRGQDVPAEFFQHENSNQIADMKNMESGLMKYFETHHAEEGAELMMESEALPLNSDTLESSDTMKVQNNTNNNGGQKSLSKKCKTWSSFYNIPSKSAVQQSGMKEPGDGIEDHLSSSKRKEEFDREIHRNNEQSEDSEDTPQSGRSTELTDFIEASDPLQDGRSTEQTESARNGKFSELPDVLLNGRSTELSEDSISQRELTSFLSSRDSFTSDSGDEDYDEPDMEEMDGNERNLNGKHLSKSTIDTLEKTETIDDESNLQNDKDRTSVKSMSVGHCAGKDHKYHRDLFSAGQSQSERDRQCENRHKKNRPSWSLTSDTLSRERFWKYHTNCCNENKPCPTAKKVLNHLKHACGESLHHESVRMTKEQFWAFHTYCCAEDMPCPTAKKVLKHLKNEHSESSSNDYARLTSKRFWKYHRNCCDDSKPCPTAKKVMQQLKIVTSQPADALATQSPPSDTDLLEDCPALPLFPPKHTNEEDPCAEGDSTRMLKSQTFFTLPNLHVHLNEAGLCAAPVDSTANNSPTSGTPYLITVEPTLPGRCPQEPSSRHLPECRVDTESRNGDRWTLEPMVELQGMFLKIPGNQKGELTGCPVGDNAGTSFSTSKRSDLKISRVAFADTNLPERPKALHSSSRRTLDTNVGGGLSKVHDDDLVYVATKASPLIDVSSIETLHNPSVTENSTGTLHCWDFREKSVSRAAKIDQSKNEPENSAARQDKKESICDSNVLLEELHARELCNQKHVNIKSNTKKKMTHYNMQSTPSISNKSSIKYSCNRIGVVHNQFLDSLCDKYINQSDEMKERICSNNALWKALMLDGFVYKKKGEKSHTLRTIDAGEGNGSRVQETNFDSRCRKPFAFRGDDPLCTPVKNLTVSRHSTEVHRYARRTEHTHGSNLPGGCLVYPLRKKNKINLNDNSMARFARKTYHSVFSSALGIPSCHNENTGVVCPEKSTQEGIQVRESQCPNSTEKESQSIAAEICKSSEDLSPYLKSPCKSSQQKKSVHASSYQESDQFSPDSSELSVLANLHFCKITGSPAINIPDSDENRNPGPCVVDGLVTFEPVISNSGPQNIPPTKEELLTDNELAVIHMLCNFKKSVQHPEELLS